MNGTVSELSTNCHLAGRAKVKSVKKRTGARTTNWNLLENLKAVSKDPTTGILIVAKVSTTGLTIPLSKSLK